MEWMLDTANIEEIRKGLSAYPLSGVTTNPTILKREMPISYYDHLAELRSLCAGLTLHIQLGSETCDGMLAEAEKLWAHLGREVYLKVPVTQEGLKAMLRLKKSGARITATAVYYPIQGMLAISAGADYLAPYCNRMEQNAIDFGETIAQLRRMTDRENSGTKILAASFKNAGQIVRAIDAGAHAVTVPPSLLETALSSVLVMDTVHTFSADHQAVLQG